MNISWTALLLLGSYIHSLPIIFAPLYFLTARIQGVTIHHLNLPGLISSSENQIVNIDCQYSIDQVEADSKVWKPKQYNDSSVN